LNEQKDENSQDGITDSGDIEMNGEEDERQETQLEETQIETQLEETQPETQSQDLDDRFEPDPIVKLPPIQPTHVSVSS
jgi:hypothetical protein